MVGKQIFAVLIAFTFALRIYSQQLLPQANQTPPAPDWSEKIDLGLYSMAWSPNSELLAVGGRGTVRIYRLPNFSD